MSSVVLYMSDVEKQSQTKYTPFNGHRLLLASTDKTALSESFAGQYVSMREENKNIYNFATRKDSQEIQISINLLRHQCLPITI